MLRDAGVTLGLFLCVAVLPAPPAAAQQESPAAAVRKLTGKHTRIVWTRGITADMFGWEVTNRVVALDTDDGGSECQHGRPTG